MDMKISAPFATPKTKPNKANSNPFLDQYWLCFTMKLSLLRKSLICLPRVAQRAKWGVNPVLIRVKTL